MSRTFELFPTFASSIFLIQNAFKSLTIERYDKIKKWRDIQVFKRKILLYHIHDLASNENTTLLEDDSSVEPSEPWKSKSTFDPPKTDNKDLESFLDRME